MLRARSNELRSVWLWLYGDHLKSDDAKFNMTFVFSIWHFAFAVAGVRGYVLSHAAMTFQTATQCMFGRSAASGIAAASAASFFCRFTKGFR